MLANSGGPGQVGANCAWYVLLPMLSRVFIDLPRISRDVINYVRTDGSVLGAALLAAVDNVGASPSALFQRIKCVRTVGCKYGLGASLDLPTTHSQVNFLHVLRILQVDKAMNQGHFTFPRKDIALNNALAKSNVVNDNKAGPGDPPQAGSTVGIVDFHTSEGDIYDVETFLRNFAALGQCRSHLSRS